VTPSIYTLSLHDALPISGREECQCHVSVPAPVTTYPRVPGRVFEPGVRGAGSSPPRPGAASQVGRQRLVVRLPRVDPLILDTRLDRKSTRLNSSHSQISY